VLSCERIDRAVVRRDAPKTEGRCSGAKRCELQGPQDLPRDVRAEGHRRRRTGRGGEPCDAARLDQDHGAVLRANPRGQCLRGDRAGARASGPPSRSQVVGCTENPGSSSELWVKRILPWALLSCDGDNFPPVILKYRTPSERNPRGGPRVQI